MCRSRIGGMIILESAVGRGKDVQDIGVHRKFEKCVVTLLVTVSAVTRRPQFLIGFKLDRVARMQRYLKIGICGATGLPIITG